MTLISTTRAGGREEELDEALAAFCHKWNRGSDKARFEKEYLLAVGTRA